MDTPLKDDNKEQGVIINGIRVYGAPKRIFKTISLYGFLAEFRHSECIKLMSMYMLHTLYLGWICEQREYYKYTYIYDYPAERLIEFTALVNSITERPAGTAGPLTEKDINRALKGIPKDIYKPQSVGFSAHFNKKGGFEFEHKPQILGIYFE